MTRLKKLTIQVKEEEITYGGALQEEKEGFTYGGAVQVVEAGLNFGVHRVLGSEKPKKATRARFTEAKSEARAFFSKVLFSIKIKKILNN